MHTCVCAGVSPFTYIYWALKDMEWFEQFQLEVRNLKSPPPLVNPMGIQNALFNRIFSFFLSYHVSRKLEEITDAAGLLLGPDWYRRGRSEFPCILLWVLAWFHLADRSS